MVVTKILTNDTYRISELRREGGKQYATTVHMSLLKGHLPETDDEPDDPQTEENNKSDAESDDEPNEGKLDQPKAKPLPKEGEGLRPTRNRHPPKWHLPIKCSKLE